MSSSSGLIYLVSAQNETMLLHRFPVKCVPNQDTKVSEKNSMTIMVSSYRRSIDPVYQKMVCHQISQGVLDEYVSMMIVSLVNNGKHFCKVAMLPLSKSLTLFINSCYLGTSTTACKESIQSKLSEFEVDAKYKDAWEVGLQLLGKPLTARLILISEFLIKIFYDWLKQD